MQTGPGRSGTSNESPGFIVRTMQHKCVGGLAVAAGGAPSRLKESAGWYFPQAHLCQRPSDATAPASAYRCPAAAPPPAPACQWPTAALPGHAPACQYPASAHATAYPPCHFGRVYIRVRFLRGHSSARGWGPGGPPVGLGVKREVWEKLREVGSQLGYLTPGGILFLLTEKGTVVPLLTSAAPSASLPRRCRHAPGKVFLMTVKLGGCSPPLMQ